jgi:EAL domain-containing protein (putative c-di-GMP-specific phosphodiesterase class I)
MQRGELHAAEALLRFTMSSGERISPVEFIPILEESGLILPVGKWVITQAISMCKKARHTIQDFRVGVNLSYVQLLKSPIADELCTQLATSGVDPSGIVIELTESGYLESTPAVRRVWNHLKSYGITIALDDFGTGYSNMQSLGSLHPDILKLDREFTVKAIANIYENRLMCHVVDMAKSLHIQVCIEGVETEDDLSVILPMQPDFIQGYYYGEPCSWAEFSEQFLEKY